MAGQDIQRQQGSLEELKELMREIETVMMVTMTDDGLLHARPMAVPDLDVVPDCDLVLLTSRDTNKVAEVEREHQVCLCAVRDRDRAYVSVSATARVSEERDAIRRLWKPSWQTWFPGGPEDPSLVLLKLEVEHAEYWEPEGGRLRVLYAMARSLVGGESAEQHLNPPSQI